MPSVVQEEPALAKLSFYQEIVYVLLVHCQDAALMETAAQEEAAMEGVKLQQECALLAPI
jgi:hypothetical protein